VVDPDLVEPRSDAIACALDLFLAGDLGLTQGLDAGNLKLLQRTAAFEPGRLQRRSRSTSATSTSRLAMISASLTLASAAARSALVSASSTTRCSSACSTLRALDIDHLAGFLAGDALLFQRQFGRHARRFHRLAAGDLGAFELAVPLDFAGAHLLVGGDALGLQRTFLRDTGLFHRLVGGNACLVDGLVAGNLAALGGLVRVDPARCDLLLAGDPRGLNRFAGGNLGGFHGLLALDFQLADPLDPRRCGLR
jgi:hypothetical protein